MEFLGRIRPRRLLEKFDPTHLGIMQKESTVAVERIEFLGDQPVVGLGTSTKTFIAEGLASHNSEEYEMQRAGIHYLTYIARAQGIEVGCPPESDLFTPRFKYGIDEWTHSFRKTRARASELAARRGAAVQRMKEAEQEMTFLSGALDDIKYMGDTWAAKDERTGPRPLPAPPYGGGLADLS
jgi:hypothetical protein